jgi:hypothetical protein
MAMRKIRALKLKRGDLVMIHPPRVPIRSASDVHIAKVIAVTERGGILVDVLHGEHWTGQVVARRWVPYHHCALYAAEHV